MTQRSLDINKFTSTLNNEGIAAALNLLKGRVWNDKFIETFHSGLASKPSRNMMLQMIQTAELNDTRSAAERSSSAEMENLELRLKLEMLESEMKIQKDRSSQFKKDRNYWREKYNTEFSRSVAHLSLGNLSNAPTPPQEQPEHLQGANTKSERKECQEKADVLLVIDGAAGGESSHVPTPRRPTSQKRSSDRDSSSVVTVKRSCGVNRSTTSITSTQATQNESHFKPTPPNHPRASKSANIAKPKLTPPPPAPKPSSSSVGKSHKYGMHVTKKYDAAEIKLANANSTVSDLMYSNGVWGKRPTPKIKTSSKPSSKFTSKPITKKRLPNKLKKQDILAPQQVPKSSAKSTSKQANFDKIMGSDQSDDEPDLL